MTRVILVATLGVALAQGASAQDSPIIGRWAGSISGHGVTVQLQDDFRPDGSFMSYCPQTGITVYGSWQYDGSVLHMKNDRLSAPGVQFPPSEDDTVSVQGNTMTLENPALGNGTLYRSGPAH